MSRDDAVAAACAMLDEGRFAEELARLVAIPSESQNPDQGDALDAYVGRGIRPLLEAAGFTCTILTEAAAKGPFLYAERIEDPRFRTLFGYGHGDTVRGMAGRWADGRSPWHLDDAGEVWFGRGVADNKGQHLIGILALTAVLNTRGSLGFNAEFLIETGEEVGSPGLRALCEAERERFAADVLIASDGPRLARDRPTIFLGARGALSFDLVLEARAGGHHSGNWGGLLANPGIELAHAIGSLVGPTGQIRLPALVPPGIPDSVRAALADCAPMPGPDDPQIDAWWGEPGLSAAEKVFGWCNLEVLAMSCGTPEAPVNAVPPSGSARMQLRFVVGVDPQAVLPAIRAHLDRHGFGRVEIRTAGDEVFGATRLDPADPWAIFVRDSITATMGAAPAVLPNLGGALPNDIFVDVLGLPTVWVPHSYPGCSQHAPDEHLPKSIAREGLAMMAGIYWDLGAGG